MRTHRRFAAFRKARNATLTELAGELGCSPQMLGYVERGERTPGLLIASGIERLTKDWSNGPIRAVDWLAARAA